MSQRWVRWGVFAAGLGLILAVAIGIGMMIGGRGTPDRSGSQPVAGTSASSGGGSSRQEAPDLSDPGAAPAPGGPAAIGASAWDAPRLLRWLNDFAGRLRDADPATRQEALAAWGELASGLAEADTAVAVAAILEFLRSGADAPTGLGFRVGEGGAMAEAPTLRTALLDKLGQLDPHAAGRQAADTFAKGLSPEEWALGMRNVAWSSPDGGRTPGLVERFNEMMNRPDWSGSPSAGYLEAFDIAVASEDPGLFDRLAGLQRKDTDPSVLKASFMALDRMVLRQPDLFLAQVASDPSLLAGQPAVRAALMARADPGREPQAAALAAYLRDKTIGTDEAQLFASYFPMFNRIESYRLVTRTGSETLAYDQLARQVEAAHRAAQEWAQSASLSAAMKSVAPLVLQRTTELVQSVAAGRRERTARP